MNKVQTQIVGYNHTMSKVAALVLFSAARASGRLDGTYQHEASAHTTRLRADLLANYDKHAPPTSNRSASGVEYSKVGTAGASRASSSVPRASTSYGARRST